MAVISWLRHLIYPTWGNLSSIIFRRKVDYPFDGRSPLEIGREYFSNQGISVKFKLTRRDDRGEEYSVKSADREYRLYYTVKNDVRGGTQHKSTHHCQVVAGRVLWQILKKCDDCPAGRVRDERLCSAGTLIITPPDTPHMMISIGNPSITVEWLDSIGFDEEPFAEFYEMVMQPK